APSDSILHRFLIARLCNEIRRSIQRFSIAESQFDYREHYWGSFLDLPMGYRNHYVPPNLFGLALRVRLSDCLYSQTEAPSGTEENRSEDNCNRDVNGDKQPATLEPPPESTFIAVDVAKHLVARSQWHVY